MTSFDLERICPRVSRPWILGAVVVFAVGLAVDSSSSTPRVQAGPFDGLVKLEGDIREGRYGPWATVSSAQGLFLAEFDDPPLAVGGDVLVVQGETDGVIGELGGDRYSSRLEVSSFEVHSRGSAYLRRLGSTLRSWTLARLEPLEGGRALLAGFLIGDTSGVDPADVESMRRAGLSHFVAVSGSNVGLFLLLLALAAGPLALGPKRRAIVGLVGLPVFAAVTRFDPSVMRASFMAGIALTGRLVGIVLEAWQLLSLSVVALVILDPSLTHNVGFQLSVVATAGVIAGSRWPTSSAIGRALAIAFGAQLFVAPLLVAHFDSAPLLAPLANLIAAPVVAASTMLGAVGLFVPGLTHVASWLADVVILIAQTASRWPAAGLVGVLAVAVIPVAASLSPRTRAPLAVAVAGMLLWILLPGGHPPPGSVVVLDVGQGDAILLHGGEGHFALIDGGPDPVRLEERLKRHGVTALQFVVLTHVHADHATGLTGLVGRVPIGRVFADTDPHSTAASDDLMTELDHAGVPVTAPRVGEKLRLGKLTLRFEGPVRRYASPNDQSVVVTVAGASRTMLLSGDIETHAQADLGHLRADVLKVPHQGAGTSDDGWLQSVGATVAVISVGPNQFGHPVPWVIESLESSGSDVLRTDEIGDVVIDLS